jgi:hypothetical protein
MSTAQLTRTSVVDDVRRRLDAALDAGELTPATVARLLATVHAHGHAAGLETEGAVPEDLPAGRVQLAPGITIEAARDEAWHERRRRLDVD